MANTTAQPFTDHMQLLFGVGTCAGLTDGQLLERFMGDRDESGELAFEAIVARHGPMVMRVCRNVLEDPNDVHDAFQAVFLVLARRSNTIRDCRSISSWLYGVAVRVSARARVTVVRRQIRDRRTIAAAQTSAKFIGDQCDGPPNEWTDQADVVHQELTRLPEKFRAPVVLCYLEGLTHDEAAARLSWPVGTVRSRLARARDKLRSRLNRRGVTASASLGPMANWLAGEPVEAARLMATVSAASSAPITRELLTQVLRSVTGQTVRQTTAAGSITSTSTLLAQGVLNAMLLKKLTIIVCALLPLGTIAIGGGVMLGRQSRAQDHPPAVTSAPNGSQAATKTNVPKPPEADPMLAQLVEAALKRVDAQKAFYEEGRMTIDRFIDAISELEFAQLMAARTDAERATIKERHLAILKEVEQREKAEIEVGRGTVSDLAEAVQRRLQAEAALKSDHDLPSILRRLKELERKVDELQKERAKQ